MLAVTGHPVHHACTLRVQRISRHFCPNIGPGAFPGASGSPWGWSLMACRDRSGAGGHNCPQRHNFGLYGSNKLNLQGRADRGAQKRSMLRFWMVWADRRRGRSGPSNVIRLSSSAFGSRPRACLGPNGQRGRFGRSRAAGGPVPRAPPPPKKFPRAQIPQKPSFRFREHRPRQCDGLLSVDREPALALAVREARCGNDECQPLRAISSLRIAVTALAMMPGRSA